MKILTMKTLTKHSITITGLLLVMLTPGAYSQLSNGGVHGYFGIDADTRAAYAKYGPTTGSVGNDDWFGPMTGANRGVIDTSNASMFRTRLQLNINTSFSKGMSVPMYTKVNNTLWLDAMYARDHISRRNAAGLVTGKDSTSFSGGSKNGDNPSSWTSSTESVTDKIDLIDAFAHMRRNGLTVNDSLWLYSAVTTTGTSGARYYDVELYKNDFSYSRTTNMFTSSGVDAGHTQWRFDATGNIIQAGDLIIAVNISPGVTPVIEPRIWVSYATFTSVSPSLFMWGTYDGNTAAGGFGYASITSKTGGTAFGAGIANYTVTTVSDSTNAGPWGSVNLIAAGHQWSANYQSLQFVEVGLNLTRIGVDPGLYTALGSSPCDEIFSSILIKSRASSSFTSALQDFVAPVNFLNLPALNYSLRTDTISCTKPVGSLRVMNNASSGYFKWSTIGGNIVASNTDSTVVNISAPGKYIVNASEKEGCPVKGLDTLIVPADTSKPIATAGVRSNEVGQPQLLGGDTTASNYATPFGGSKGLLWNWTGPNGFTANTQNPTTNNDVGMYNLNVTERRNGCTTSSAIYVNFSMLEFHNLGLQGNWRVNRVELNWNKNAGKAVSRYEVERSVSGNAFHSIAIINGAGEEAESFKYNDYQPINGAVYRIKAVTDAGNIYYSAVVKPANNSAAKNNYQVNNTNSRIYLVANADQQATGKVFIYTLDGKLLNSRAINISKGTNTIELSGSEVKSQQLLIISLYIANERVMTEKFFNR